MPRIALLLVLLNIPLPTAAAEPDIWAAARAGDLPRVKALIESGVDVDAATRYRATALYFAAEEGHLELVEFLLDQGADPNVREAFIMRTPLSVALHGEHVEVAVRLIEGGAYDILAPPLFFGVKLGQPAVVAAAVEQGPVYDYEKNAALELAREAGSEELAALVEKAQVRTELQVVELAAGRLAEIAGHYRSEERAVESFLRAGHIWLREEDGEETRLVALSEHHFRSPEDHDFGAVFGGRLDSIENLRLVRGTSVEWFGRYDPAIAAPVTDAPPDAPPAAEVAAPRAAAINWPSFRGAAAGGLGDGQGIPTTWDVESGKNVRWKTEVPGLGYSSPVIWGDRLFVTTAIASAGLPEESPGGDGGTGDLSPQTWKVLALDKSSGEIVWQRTAGAAKPLTDHHSLSSHANSTPATDGRRLVAVFPTIGMFCYSVSGELLWKKDLGPLNAGNYTNADNHWGFAASPVLYEGAVILQADVHEGAFLAAYDLETGRQLWKTPRDEISGWATPLVYRGADHDELVTNAATIRGYDPRTGRELWRLRPNSEQVVATPITAHGLIYVTTGYPPARPIYAVRPGQRGDLSLASGATQSGAIAWSHDRGGAYMATPIIYRGLLYIANGGGRLGVFDALTGERIYRARFSRQAGFTSSPVAADGRLYFPNEHGPIVVVKAGPKYEELAVNDMGEAVLTTPAISDGSLFVRTRGHVYALGSRLIRVSRE